MNCDIFRGSNQDKISDTRLNHDNKIMQLQIDPDMIAASEIRNLPQSLESPS